MIEKRLRYNVHQRINALIRLPKIYFVEARIRNKGNFCLYLKKRHCKVQIQKKGSRKTTCRTFDTFDCEVKPCFFMLRLEYRIIVRYSRYKYFNRMKKKTSGMKKLFSYKSPLFSALCNWRCNGLHHLSIEYFWISSVL